MSVKKMGSKLVQGVRQIKAQQDNAPPVITAESTTDAKRTGVARAVTKSAPAKTNTPPDITAEVTTDVKKTGVARAATKPAPAKTVDSSVLHPPRIWPD
jgi:hypothetical protein